MQKSNFAALVGFMPFTLHLGASGDSMQCKNTNNVINSIILWTTHYQFASNKVNSGTSKLTFFSKNIRTIVLYWPQSSNDNGGIELFKVQCGILIDNTYSSNPI